MFQHRSSILIGVLAFLVLLFHVTGTEAVDCGFPLPCTDNLTSGSPGINITNYGAGPAMEAHAADGDGLVASSNGATKSGIYAINYSGAGYGVYAVGQGGGWGVYAKSSGTGVEGEGNIGVLGRSSASTAVHALNEGSGYGVVGTSILGTAGYFYNTNNANSKPTLKVWTNGTGWAANFVGSGANAKGVYISTKAGNKGLQVAGGTKSAVVATSQGARTLYAEEASEVYFTDYGFGHLQNGRATIGVDPLFAETVNLEKGYYVFLQPYGEAEIYVSETTPTAFEVKLRARDAEGDANVKFAYRIVGKRRGYEQARLERAQWADNDPNLYPAKPLKKMAAKK